MSDNLRIYEHSWFSFEQQSQCDKLLCHICDSGGAKRQLLTNICSAATLESYWDRSVGIGKFNVAQTSVRRFATQLRVCAQLRQHIVVNAKPFSTADFTNSKKQESEAVNSPDARRASCNVKSRLIFAHFSFFYYKRQLWGTVIH